MTPDEMSPEQLFELVHSALVPFLCERTGFKRRHVELVLEAERLFWAMRPKQLHQMMGFMTGFMDHWDNED